MLSLDHVMFSADETGGQSTVASPKKYTALGIPEEWVEPLQKLGYTTIDKIKTLEKPRKLHLEMMGFRKKNKLEIGTVTMEDVALWIQ
ncbi:hypothetical protein ACFLQX_03240 [Bacteroidota bacterium]